MKQTDDYNKKKQVTDLLKHLLIKDQKKRTK